VLYGSVARWLAVPVCLLRAKHFSLPPPTHPPTHPQPNSLSLDPPHRGGCLQEAREAQAAAEAKAAEAAKVGAARRLREAEGRVESLEGTLAELRGELERQVGRGLGFCAFR
jgi:hypothetical protein